MKECYDVCLKAGLILPFQLKSPFKRALFQFFFTSQKASKEKRKEAMSNGARNQVWNVHLFTLEVSSGVGTE